MRSPSARSRTSRADFHALTFASTNVAVRDYALGRKQVERILEWDIDGALLAHGALVEHGGRETIRDAYAWL